MKQTIDRAEKTPAYLQLYRQIREDIEREIYPFQSKLPSKRTVAEELGVSAVTVEHAYALLCEEGYVEARQRSGYFVIFRASDSFAASPPQADAREPRERRMREAEAAGDAQSAPEPTQQDLPRPTDRSLFPFPLLARTMRRVISDYGERLLARSANSGCEELRTAIEQYLARSRRILVKADQIVVGSGAEYLYGLLVKLLGLDRVYALESPSYQKIEQVYRASGVRCELLPLGSDGVESAALWTSNADVLHITPYRSFPSGVTATASKRHEYLRWAARPGRYIIEDDFESEFSVLRKAEETLFSHTQADNVIYMNTFSRTVSPALRVGYMVLPEHLAAAFEAKLGFYSCTVPTFEQLLLARLLTDGSFERHISRVRRAARKMPQQASVPRAAAAPPPKRTETAGEK